MTKESIAWLNQNTLIGFADKREQWAAAGGWVRQNDEGLIVPWHAQDGYDNAYSGPVPIDAIMSKLFAWEAESRETFIKVPCDINEATGVDDQGNPFKLVQLDGYQTIVRNDTNEPFEVFRGGYQIHSYKEWLLDNVANILDDELGVESALLLRNGGVACISVSLPDAVVGDAEFPLLVRLMAYTAHNGSYATGYAKTPYSPVCDNSMSALVGRAESGGNRVIKYKHTKNSAMRIGDARSALSILHQQAEEMVQFFDLLAAWDVTNSQVRKVIEQVIPTPEPKVQDGNVTNQRSITIAEQKQVEVAMAYRTDPRVSHWNGTALGVLQAFNTWEQQIRGGIKSNRVERNTLNSLSNVDSEFDAIVLNALSDVTGVGITTDQTDKKLQLAAVGAS